MDGREAEFDSDGFFLGVSLIDDVTADIPVYTEEIFGPVLSVVRVDTLQAAVELVSDNRWGNGAAIFTRDGRGAPPLPERRLCGHDRCPCRHTSSRGLPLVRWLEGLRIRRHDHVRTRGHSLLDQAEGVDQPMAGPLDQHPRSRIPGQ